MSESTALDSKQFDAFQLSAGLFAECKVVAEFTSGFVRSLIPKPEVLSDPDRILFQQLLRADAWLRTLAKLNAPGDFQAVSAGCRSLLESSVDVVLVAEDKTRAQKVIDWEESARLKHAVALDAYYKKVGIPVPKESAAVVKGLDRKRGEIDELRKRNGWLGDGKPRHPERWTGRKLDRDCIAADGCLKNPDFSFERFYETRYRELCWNVHGSAMVVSKLNAEIFPFVGGRAFRECAELGQIVGECVIRGLGLWSEDVAQAFANLTKHRVLTAWLTMKQHAPSPF